MRARFVCGYQGESEFQVGTGRFAVRARAYDSHPFDLGHYAASVVPSVGTVRDCDRPDRFPPAEVVALFPGFVGARWDFEAGAIRYDGPPPATSRDEFGVICLAPNPHMRAG